MTTQFEILFSFSSFTVHWAASSLFGIAYSTSGCIGISDRAWAGVGGSAAVEVRVALATKVAIRIAAKRVTVFESIRGTSREIDCL